MGCSGSRASQLQGCNIHHCRSHSGFKKKDLTPTYRGEPSDVWGAHLSNTSALGYPQDLFRTRYIVHGEDELISLHASVQRLHIYPVVSEPTG